MFKSTSLEIGRIKDNNIAMSVLAYRRPALLSLALPGLGQLSQKRYPWAVGFFAVFVFVTLAEDVWWTLPCIALVAGLETLRSDRTVASKDRTRKIAYGSIGALGLLCWVGFFGVHFFSLGGNMRINEDVDALRAVFRRCQTVHQGDDPTILNCVQFDPDALMKDPWGTSYDISLRDGTFEVRSLGRDKILGSDDDYVYTLFHKSEKGGE